MKVYFTCTILYSKEAFQSKAHLLLADRNSKHNIDLKMYCPWNYLDLAYDLDFNNSLDKSKQIEMLSK